jgi:hypothetical protein
MVSSRSPRLTRPEAAQPSATSATSTLASDTAAPPAALPPSPVAPRVVSRTARTLCASLLSASAGAMSRTYGAGKRRFGRLEHLRQWRRAQWPGGLASRPGCQAAPSRRARPGEAQEPSSGHRAKRVLWVLWPCGWTTSPVEARSSCEAASWSVTGAPLIASSRSPTATLAAAAAPSGRTPRITEGRPLAPPVVLRTRHVMYARDWYAYRARTVRPPPSRGGQAAVRLRCVQGRRRPVPRLWQSATVAVCDCGSLYM